jgi:hypothetical protein
VAIDPDRLLVVLTGELFDCRVTESQSTVASGELPGQLYVICGR